MRRSLSFFLVLVAAANSAAALTITVDSRLCRGVTAHRPAPGVEYQPGVDVHGKSVVPGDLNSGFAIDAVRDVIVDIGADLARRLGVAPVQAPFIADASVGYLVFEDGRLLFNGRPLQDPLEDELAALCATARHAR